jgi:flagellar basal body-associated protein FliL
VIVGLIIGIVLLLIVGGIILFLILRKKRKNEKKRKNKQKTFNYPLMEPVGGTVVLENTSTVQSNLTTTYQPGILLTGTLLFYFIYQE